MHLVGVANLRSTLAARAALVAAHFEQVGEVRIEVELHAQSAGSSPKLRSTSNS